MSSSHTITFGAQVSPCFLPPGSVTSSFSQKLLFKRDRWAELSARFIYSWHSQRQFRWSRKCHPVPASLPCKPPGGMTGRQSPGEETPPQVAQMTNRFPHFLIYPVPALIWALLLFCPPLGLPPSQSRAQLGARSQMPLSDQCPVPLTQVAGQGSGRGTLSSSLPLRRAAKSCVLDTRSRHTTLVVKTLTSLLGQLLLLLPTGWCPSFGLWALTGHPSSSLPGCLPEIGTRTQRALCTGGAQLLSLESDTHLSSLQTFTLLYKTPSAFEVFLTQNHPPPKEQNGFSCIFCDQPRGRASSDLSHGL